MGNPTAGGSNKRKRRATNSNKSEMWNSSSKKKRGSASSASGFNADEAETLFQEIADEDDDQVAGMEGTVGFKMGIVIFVSERSELHYND